MRNKLGTLFMILGAGLLLGAIFLLGSNQQEAVEAEKAAEQVLPRLIEAIETTEETTLQTQTEAPAVETPLELLTPSDVHMTEVVVDGYGYIGYVAIPKLGLELPVMGDWSYARLRTAPCRYTGSVRGGDMVIMAHNYTKHFGRLSSLSEGDSVIFTDMEGDVTAYEVVCMDILAPTAVEEMTSGDFDLTLFTCTYGGQSRVTVYCDQVK